MNKNEMDFNYNECVKSREAYGKTIYTNICNEKTNTVEWGIEGYFAFWSIATLVIFIIIAMIGFIKLLFSNL